MALRRTTRKTVKRATKKTAVKTTKRKGKPFGGYAINFKGRSETVEHVFGKTPVSPSEMTKKIWQFVKRKRLATK